MKNLVAFAGLLILSACGKHTPTSSGEPLSQTQTTADYVFRYAPGDAVDPAWQEAYYQWAIAALDVHPPQRVTYNKYLSRSHMGDVTGKASTNGYAEPATFTIHTIWPFDNHEVIHVYSSLFGSPVPLFNEGIAVAHQTDPSRNDFTPRWNGVALHEQARVLRQQGRLIALGSLLTAGDFRRFDDNVTYPEAGSFVEYLLEHDGLERMKTFFRGGNPSDAADSVRQRFLLVFGRSIDDAEREWWARLDAG